MSLEATFKAYAGGVEMDGKTFVKLLKVGVKIYIESYIGGLVK